MENMEVSTKISKDDLDLARHFVIQLIQEQAS